MRDAAGKGSRIHRNISVGSILLVNDPGSDTRKGYLIDWELSSRVDQAGQSIARDRVVCSPTVSNLYALTLYL